MTIKRTTQKADAILAIIDDLTIDSLTLWLEPYQNGRERGWSLYKDGKRVSFSENRNSDAIVIYSGNSEEFDMSGNIPSGKAYQERKLFSYDAVYQAAEYIVKFFEDK